MTTDFSTRIPDVLFELSSDPTFEDAKHILRHANKWLDANPTSEFYPVILSARNRLGERVTNAFLSTLITKETK